jgi:hypothetical protein
VAAEEVLDLDHGLLERGKRSLRALGLPPQLLDGALVAAGVQPSLLLELLEHELHHALIEVLSAQVRVTARCNHFEHTTIDLATNSPGQVTRVFI